MPTFVQVGISGYTIPAPELVSDGSNTLKVKLSSFEMVLFNCREVSQYD